MATGTLSVPKTRTYCETMTYEIGISGTPRGDVSHLPYRRVPEMRYESRWIHNVIFNCHDQEILLRACRKFGAPEDLVYSALYSKK